MAPRKVTERDGRQYAAVVGADEKIEQGHLVSLKAGLAMQARAGAGADATAQAADIADHVVVGVAEDTKSGDGQIKVPYRSGCFLFANADVAAADIGAPGYVVDSATISTSHASNTRPKAGTIIDIEDAGVWVRIGL